MSGFLNQMQIASLTSQADFCECHIKDCKVVKVLLPTEVINELKKQATKVVPDALMSDTIMTFMGVPIEEDKTATNVRYVIEGELSL
jgi:hypothetical protein